MGEEWEVDGEFLLEKYQATGGWTYARIPQIAQNKEMPFGWVTVSGWVDDLPVTKHKLMPMGEGQLFFSVNAKVRKQLKKDAGDIIYLKLNRDEAPLELPDEIRECFEMVGDHLILKWNKLTVAVQKQHLDAIYLASKDDLKVERISKLIEYLENMK